MQKDLFYGIHFLVYMSFYRDTQLSTVTTLPIAFISHCLSERVDDEKLPHLLYDPHPTFFNSFIFVPIITWPKNSTLEIAEISPPVLFSMKSVIVSTEVNFATRNARGLLSVVVSVSARVASKSPFLASQSEKSRLLLLINNLIRTGLVSF
mmetsp:Transcript_2798/g.3293  ORF Transcript_2798/g.3293 Transcript_2798/m.3293 type:complete len:151 (-) Transcript_2798:484-936(-)